MTLLAQHADAEVHHCDWRSLAEIVRERGGCDALIVDAPYSAKTHEGHDGGAASANRVKANGVKDTGRQRREIIYPPWSADDVDAFVNTWAPLARGWMVSLTDDVLFPAWRAAMARHDRVTFQDVPAVIRGMTVRLTGDGPSSWAIHSAVSRPRTVEMASWKTLDGGYFGPAESVGGGRATAVVGGKPFWLMQKIAKDYSRPGDLVVDPCCGAGTTLIAAQRIGRRVIGGDVLLDHAEKAAANVRKLPARPVFGEEMTRRAPRTISQQPLFAARGRS